MKLLASAGEWDQEVLIDAHETELAVQGLGVKYNPDFNGARQAGVGPMPHTIGRGRRSHAHRAFLSQIWRDPRFTLETEATAARVLIENGRATGVEYRKGGELRRAMTQRRVNRRRRA